MAYIIPNNKVFILKCTNTSCKEYSTTWYADAYLEHGVWFLYNDDLWYCRECKYPGEIVETKKIYA
jgi:hypothetical protein